MSKMSPKDLQAIANELEQAMHDLAEAYNVASRKKSPTVTMPRRYAYLVMVAASKGLGMPLVTTTGAAVTKHDTTMHVDTARLDFLQAQEWCEVRRMGTTVPYWLVQPRDAHAIAQGPTLRQAIDDARGVPAPTTQP